ncbi:DUF2806 domain-containing protein [Aeromonas jandaei]|uniref:DUF2806 domain-containing protein n=1 Tax=Aeromonas jandaei TaxID=650 RepID=UPI0039877FF1
MSNTGFSLVDIKGISEPLTKLIDSVSKGIGTIYEPTKKIRNARADAKVMKILTEAKCETDEISSRAMERLRHRENRRQENIDSIVRGASNELPNTVDTNPVDEDWIVNFFELCQDIGNIQMQQIWAKLLAGEVANPGTFKPRTLQTVKSLTSEEAHMFTLLCEFSFKSEDGANLLPNFSHNYYEFIRAHGLTTNVELHLKSIGLLNNSDIWYGADDNDETIITLDYFNKKYLASSEPDEGAGILLSAFPFTDIGNELASISGAKPNEKYIEHLLEHGDISMKGII